ncbi:MAG: site-specific integrase [Bacteroidia bacterium]|nr:site-specific integrase [Bacteroidia bacterium]
MATVSIKFRTSSRAGEKGSLYYLVIHERKSSQVRSGYRLYPWEWDSGRGEVTCPAGTGEERKVYLNSLQSALRDDLKRLISIISRFKHLGNPYTAADVIRVFRAPETGLLFASFAYEIVAQLKEMGKSRTSETYAAAVNSFMRFRKGRDVPLDEIDFDLMVSYGAYLSESGVCRNAVSFYMRNLRAIYNRAVDKELTVQRFPFKHVYTGIGKTVKRAVPIEVIRRIRDLDLSGHPAMDYARDLFMFSFYTRGMSFVDIAFLKKKDLRDGTLSYRRRKTNRRLLIKWEKPMQELIDKYDTSSTPYLMPIIKVPGEDERGQYLNEAHRVNRNLKKIGKLLGLEIPLTTYVARHGWASIAWSKNIPVSTISEAMGHDSENTTRIYLASLDTSVVDKANSLILRSL